MREAPLKIRAVVWSLLVGAGFIGTLQRAVGGDIDDWLSNGTATPISPTSMNINWTPTTPGPIAGTNVLRSTKIGGPYLTVGSVPNPPYQDTGLQPSMSYFYRLIEYDTSGNTRELGPFAGTTLSNYCLDPDGYGPSGPTWNDPDWQNIDDGIRAPNSPWLDEVEASHAGDDEGEAQEYTMANPPPPAGNCSWPIKALNVYIYGHYTQAAGEDLKIKVLGVGMDSTEASIRLSTTHLWYVIPFQKSSGVWQKDDLNPLVVSLTPGNFPGNSKIYIRALYVETVAE